MSKYEAHYSIEFTEGNEGPDGEKYAQGHIEFDTDVEIETEEQVREISKQLYRTIDGGTGTVAQLSVDTIYVLDNDGSKIELDR